MDAGPAWRADEQWRDAFDGSPRCGTSTSRRMSGVPLDRSTGPPTGEPPERDRLARPVPLHPRAVRLDVPLEAVDDAHVRRLRHRRGHQPALPGPPCAPAAPACRRPSTCPRSWAATPTTRCARARSASAASPSTPWPTCEDLFAGIDLGAVTTSMTINSPAAVIFAMYIATAEKAGVERAAPRRHAPERHPEGVPGAEGVRVPAAAVDAPRARHHRASARPRCRGGTRSRSPATTSARRARRPRRSSPSRWPTGSPTSSWPARRARRRRRSPRASASSSTPTSTSSRRSPSTGPPAASGPAGCATATAPPTRDR